MKGCSEVMVNMAWNSPYSFRIGVPASTRRHYEKEGLITPRRDANQVREYEDGDLGWTRFSP